MYLTFEEAVKDLELTAEALPDVERRYAADKKAFELYLHSRRMTLTRYVKGHETAIRKGKSYIKYLYEKESEELASVLSTLNRIQAKKASK